MKVDRPDRWKWKLRAIDTFAKESASTLGTCVAQERDTGPHTPSKSVSSSDYDDRMTEVLKAIGKHAGINCVRELGLFRLWTRNPLTRDERRDLELIKADYRINESLTNPSPQRSSEFSTMCSRLAHTSALLRAYSLSDFRECPLQDFSSPDA